MLDISRELLIQLYVNQNKSSYEIAEELGTYSKRILRLLKKYQIPIKSQAESIQNAADTGRLKPPMEGKHHSEETKDQISQSIHATLQQETDEVKQAKAKKISDSWQKLGQAKRDEVRHLAAQALLRTTKEGSRVEKFLLTELSTKYKVYHHHKTWVDDEQMHFDLFLPEIKFIIEVDGPTHFVDLYGKARLRSQQMADRKKNAIVIGQGFRMLRILQLSKKLSKIKLKLMLEEVLQILQKPITLTSRVRIDDVFYQITV